jgi:stearoyl-CoA desaturase (delta-9 desaturase)
MEEPSVYTELPTMQTAPALARPGQRIDRIANATATVLPALGLGGVAWQLWGDALHWQDLVVFAVTMTLAGFGVTLGFHRLFTHRSFRTTRWMRALLAILGSAAVEGPVIEWVAYHRRHHAFSDHEGDPHSPHVGHGAGVKGALGGLFHAHVGWVVFSDEPANEQRYAPDLLDDRTIRLIDSTFIVWVAAGLAFAFGLGVALTGTVRGGLTGLLWGGAVRIFVLHHITFSINSLCHFFGGRDYETGDESRNLRWLAPFSFGEAWHNNHHAFPTSAAHGLTRWQFDPTKLVIYALEKVGLAWDVVRISPARRTARAVAPR